MADTPHITDKYADYVKHPRYGRGPRYTVLNPDLERAESGPLSHDDRPIPQTEIATAKACYRDIERLCHDCNRPFIFFAEEQIYWYETLGFSVGAVCTRCVDCRKKRQQVAGLRERYQHLACRIERSDQETLDMAEYCLRLIEKEEFTPKKLSRVRELLNSLPAEMESELHQQSRRLLERVRTLEP